MHLPPFILQCTNQVVGAAVRGGTGLMLVMVLQRGLNFLLNQLLLRHVDPTVFGIASIPLDLLLNTALFLSRSVDSVRLNPNDPTHPTNRHIQPDPNPAPTTHQPARASASPWGDGRWPACPPTASSSDAS